MYFLTNFIISILRDDLPKLTKRKLKKTGEKESPKGKMEKKKTTTKNSSFGVPKLSFVWMKKKVLEISQKK